MEQFALSLLLKSVVISAIILVVFLFNALFGKAFSARLRYALWLVLLVGLIIPFPSGSGIIPVNMSLPARIQYAQPVNHGFGIPHNTLLAPNVGVATGSLSGISFPPFQVFLIVWLTVALTVFVYHIWQYAAFLRTIRRWGVKSKDESTLSTLRTIQADTGLGHKNIDIVVCGFVSSSMLTRFFRPMILLPEKHFETDELELIFRHELIHYKHRDLFVKLLSLFAISVYWFNPLVYWMCRAMQADGEVSCDEAVLHNSDKENRHFYAEIILGMIGEKNTVRTILSTCFFYRGKFSIKKRLDSIMDTTRKMKRLSMLVFAAVIAMTLFSGSVFAVQSFDSASQSNSRLSLDEIIGIALARTGGGTVEEIEFENKDGRFLCEITIKINDKLYEVEIDTATGEIIEFEEATAALPEFAGFAEVSYDRAIAIAIARIGGGSVEEIELDYEKGILLYEVTIRHNNRRYEVKINAITEAIIEATRL